MSVAYAYARVPAVESGEEGLDLESQRRELHGYYTRHLQQRGVLWGDVYADGGNATRVNVADRTAGRRLVERITRGDHLLVVRLDRLFQGWSDALDLLSRWHEADVTVHLVREGLALSGPAGAVFLRTLAAVEGLHRSRAAETAALSQRKRRRAGAAANQFAGGYFGRLVGPRGRRRVVPDHAARRLAAHVAELHDEHGMSFADIYLHFWKEGVRTRAGKEYSLSALKRIYAAFRSGPPLLPAE